MPCSVRHAGAFLAAAAMTMLVHPPAQARETTMHVRICGSGNSAAIPLGHAPDRSRDQERCPTGCHVACMPRKRALPRGGDAL